MLSEGRRGTEKFISFNDLVTLRVTCTVNIAPKNRNGGLFQLHVDNKEVLIFKNPSEVQRCLVSLLDMYLSSLPEN